MWSVIVSVALVGAGVADGLSQPALSRRSVLEVTTTVASVGLFPGAVTAAVDDGSNMFAPKFVQEYEDFTRTDEGWSFRDVTPGKGSSDAARPGDRVVFDWSGYTIG